MTPEIAALQSQVPVDTQKKLQASAHEYEGVFLSQMFSIMFKDVDMDPMSQGSSAASDNYKSMLTNEYGKALANKGTGIGLADPIYKSLLQAQIASQEAQK